MVGLVLILGLTIYLLWIDILGLSVVFKLRLGMLWWLSILVLISIGIAIAIASSIWPYRVGSTLQIYGIPLPAAFLHLESGEWVDFITPVPIFNLLLDAVFLSAALIAPLCIAARRRWRRVLLWESQRCGVCGYDLRASPERCPECGTPRPLPIVSTSSPCSAQYDLEQ